MTSYKLGVVALAVMGVWLIAGSLVQIESLVRLSEGGGRGLIAAALGFLASIGIGIALLLGRERIGALLFQRDEEDTEGPTLEELLVSGVMIVGVCLCISGAWRVLRMVVYVVDNRGLGATVWTDFVPDLLNIGVALLVFLRPGWVLGLGRRSPAGGAA